MALYFRKSVKLGGLRITFSKSGISYSYGVKGFRITAGPRGTYATVGAGGFYYRERVDRPQQEAPADSKAGSASAQNDPTAIPSADATELVDSSSERVLAEINSRKSTPRLELIAAMFLAPIFVALRSWHASIS